MKAVRIISGRGVPLKRSDVDTDQIIPAEWLKWVERTGFEKGLFSTWKDDRNFVLNDERFIGGTVPSPARRSVSARRGEQAVWRSSIRIDAVIRPELQRHLPQQLHEERSRSCRRARPRGEADLGGDRRRPANGDHGRRRTTHRRGAGRRHHRLVPDGRADPHRFVNGLNDIGITNTHEGDIDSYESSRPSWLR